MWHWRKIVMISSFKRNPTEGKSVNSQNDWVSRKSSSGSFSNTMGLKKRKSPSLAPLWSSFRPVRLFGLKLALIRLVEIISLRRNFKLSMVVINQPSLWPDSNNTEAGNELRVHILMMPNILPKKARTSITSLTLSPYLIR